LCLLQLILVVIFVILLDRKIIGYVSLRKGPKKIIVSGILHRIADVLKLFLKETDPNQTSKFGFYMFTPFFALISILFSWLTIIFNYNSLVYRYSIIVCDIEKYNK